MAWSVKARILLAHDLTDGTVPEGHGALDVGEKAQVGQVAPEPMSFTQFINPRGHFSRCRVESIQVTYVCASNFQGFLFL